MVDISMNGLEILAYFVPFFYNFFPVKYLNLSVANPDPGSGIGAFLTSGSGIRDPE